MTDQNASANRRTRRVMVGVAAAALATGGTLAVAYAADGSGPGAAPKAAGAGATAHSGAHMGPIAVAGAYLGIDRRTLRGELRSGATLAQIAAAHGKSLDGLIAAILAAQRAHLAAAVSSGKITASRAQARIQILEQQLRDRAQTADGFGRHGVSRGRTGVLVAARYLGITPAALRAQLKGGRSLAQVADATPGRSRAGLVAALLAARRTRLDLARQAGRISAQREQQLLARAQQRIPQQVTRTQGG